MLCMWAHGRHPCWSNSMPMHQQQQQSQHYQHELEQNEQISTSCTIPLSPECTCTSTVPCQLHQYHNYQFLSQQTVPSTSTQHQFHHQQQQQQQQLQHPQIHHQYHHHHLNHQQQQQQQQHQQPSQTQQHQLQPQQGTSGTSRMSATQWYAPPTAPNFYVTDTPASNSREMRNRAEKLRRDKLNSYIGELATLVPMVSGSAKRMDKTSILRLTATHLRIYHTLLSGQNTKNTEYNSVDSSALEQLIYEQLEGFLLILTPTGKIVFVSHTVEQLLGHLQTDLMGQSIYTIASADDHDKLRVHLSLDIIDLEWRRYFNLHLAKAGPRTEAPTYEQFNVMGMIRPPVEGKNKHHNREIVQTSSNKIQNNVFVFFVKLFRPPPLSDMLIEANREEYRTRHLIDGRIVNCDHRISFVAGYMIEEVSGLSAFKFMHREDVRWTMIALRQMYDRGESVGWSCYRLLSRTGQFIYLRTLGYLEVDDTGTVESFVCINTLVSEEEGKRLIKEMKDRYSVMINSSPPQLTDDEGSVESVEDPRTIDECIKYLITSHVPQSPKTDTSSTSPQSSAPCNESQDCCYAMTELSPLNATVTLSPSPSSTPTQTHTHTHTQTAIEIIHQPTSLSSSSSSSLHQNSHQINSNINNNAATTTTTTTAIVINKMKRSSPKDLDVDNVTVTSNGSTTRKRPKRRTVSVSSNSSTTSSLDFSGLESQLIMQQQQQQQQQQQHNITTTTTTSIIGIINDNNTTGCTGTGSTTILYQRHRSSGHQYDTDNAICRTNIINNTTMSPSSSTSPLPLPPPLPPQLPQSLPSSTTTAAAAAATVTANTNVNTSSSSTNNERMHKDQNTMYQSRKLLSHNLGM